MTIEEELALAEAGSQAARADLTRTLVDIQSRLQPKVLVREALEELRDTGVQLARDAVTVARQNPGPFIGAVTTVAAILARHWFAPAHQPNAAQSPLDKPLDVTSEIADVVRKRSPKRKKTDDR